MAPSAHRLLVWLLVAWSASACWLFAADEKLVPARMTAQMDKRGGRWDIDQQGSVSDGLNDCFDNGVALQIDGNQMGFGNPKMTADGAELVLSTNFRNVAVTRRIRLDADAGIMRYLEIFESKSNGPQRLNVTIHTDLGSNAQQTLDAKDKFFSGLLGKDDGGFVAIAQGSRPGVVFLVADPKAKTKPMVRISNNRTYDVTYTLDLPATGQVAIAHYIAQRMNASSADLREVLAARTKRGRLTDTNIPAQYLTLLANFNAAPSVSEDKPAPLLAPLQEQLEKLELQRGKLDVAMLDPGSKLAGTITGGDFSIETAYGKTPVAFADVAAVEGGAGVLRALRFYLRNGEILTGSLPEAKLAMKTDSGLQLELDLSQIQFIVFRLAEQDGIAPPEATTLATTQVGDRLALRDEGAGSLEVATPWGMAKLPLAEIRAVTSVREPFPAHRVALADKSRFVAMLRGGEWIAPTLRFGPVKMIPQSLRALERLNVPAVAETGEGDAPITAPVSELIGESFLAGAIDLPALHLLAESVVTPLVPQQILKIETEIADNGARTVRVKLADGQELKGRLSENVIPLKAGDRTWRVPTAHLVAYRAPGSEVADTTIPVTSSPRAALKLKPDGNFRLTLDGQ